MKSLLSRGIRLVLATVLFGVAGVTATAAPASANSCSACVQVTPSVYDTGYRPGNRAWLSFELKNPLTTLATKITLRVTLPEGLGEPTYGWGLWNDNGTFTYDAATRTVTIQPESSTGVIGSMNPKDTWSFEFGPEVAEGVTAAELRVKTTVTWANRLGTMQPANTGKDIVLTPSKPYILESDTSFAPSTVSSGGTSVMTSTITNTGTGSARSIYFYMHIEDRLTVDQSTVPSECDYEPGGSYTTWTGDTITYSQYLDCSYSPVLGPGQSVSFSVTVTAPSVTGADKFEGSTELSCTSSGPASYDATDEGDSAALLLIDPPAPPLLHVVQMGGPKPIVMPTADAEPLQPTAGKTHSLTTYVYNIGVGDITTDVTVAVTIPEGFTPTAITAETNDSAASAPVCTLATRTCVFSRLGSTKEGVIYIEGDLAPTITDKTKLTVSAQASATSLTTATDSASFAVTSLADVRVSVSAAGAYVSGKPVAFVLATKNLGPSSLVSPVVKVTLPSGASFVTVPKGCTATGTTMTCKWTKLEAEGIDGEEFTATFGSASKASATAVLTTATPLTKDSVTKDSASQTAAPAAVASAISAAIAESSVLPATGSNSNGLTIIALMLVAGGLALVVPTRRRRAL